MGLDDVLPKVGYYYALVIDGEASMCVQVLSFEPSQNGFIISANVVTNALDGHVEDEPEARIEIDRDTDQLVSTHPNWWR